MNITMSSPDGLGDFILRIPMLQAIQADGHRLQMFLRRPAYDLAAMVFSGVELHLIAADPYHPEVRRRRNPFRSEHRAIRAFGPDLYLAALFTKNFFDEVWFESNRGHVPVAGFAPRGIRPEEVPADPGFQLKAAADVREDTPEIEKNRLLGEAVLKHGLPEEPPALRSTPRASEEAEEILKTLGLEAGGYWVACVGSRPGIRMKDWGGENWARFFSEAGGIRAVVFLGNPKESDSIDRIRDGLPMPAFNLASAPPEIPVSLALLEKSCGYVGRDSGVMHMACSVGKPVLAVYGGGHWARFLPSSGPAVVVTQATPCRGCDFACPFTEPRCIRDVTMESMRLAWSRLQEPAFRGVGIVEQPETLLPLRDMAAAAAKAYATEVQAQSRAASGRGAAERVRLAIRALAGHFCA